MPILKVQDFNRSISKISSVYLFAGEESYLVDICLNKIERFLAVDDLNKEVFYAAESSAEDILNAVQTLPFLSERRVVVVKGIDKMKAVDAERITDYLSNVIETTCLILLYNDNHKKETILKRRELINKCISSKECVSVECRKQYESEVKDFIKNEFAQKSKTTSQDVIARIIDENGTDLLNIANELPRTNEDK